MRGDREQRRWRAIAETVARSCGKASHRRAARGARAAAERSDEPRCASARRRGESPAMGAERPSNGGGRTGSFRLHRQAKRAVSVSERRRQGSSPEGRRPRSGLRGAGRGEAALGGIEPGGRSVGPGGRPDLPRGGSDDGGPSSVTTEDGPQTTGFGECRTGTATDETVAASDAGLGGWETETASVVAREARRRHAVRRTASRCAEDGFTVAGKEGSASGRRWRVSAEPGARPRVARGREAASGARAAARSAAPPVRHTPSVGRDTEQKGGRSLA